MAIKLDYGRLEDLEQLSVLLKDQRLSQRARVEVEETMQKIIHQSAPITSLRERLIRATRAGDTHAIRQIQHHIQAIRQEETKGKEF